VQRGRKALLVSKVLLKAVAVSVSGAEGKEMPR
jgi:hypothetical protein